MIQDDHEKELAVIRGQLRAANRLLGSIIANLERNASYKLTLTLRDEVGEGMRNRRTQISEDDELAIAEYDAEVEYLNNALKFSESLRWKPFRLN